MLASPVVDSMLTAIEIVKITKSIEIKNLNSGSWKYLRGFFM